MALFTFGIPARRSGGGLMSRQVHVKTEDVPRSIGGIYANARVLNAKHGHTRYLL